MMLREVVSVRGAQHFNEISFRKTFQLVFLFPDRFDELFAIGPASFIIILPFVEVYSCYLWKREGTGYEEE